MSNTRGKEILFPAGFKYSVAKDILLKLFTVVRGDSDHDATIHKLQTIRSEGGGGKKYFDIKFGNIIGISRPSSDKGYAHKFLTTYFGPQGLYDRTNETDAKRLAFFSTPPVPPSWSTVIQDLKTGTGSDVRIRFTVTSNQDMEIIEFTNVQTNDFSPRRSYHLSIPVNLQKFTDARKNTIHMTIRDDANHNDLYHEYLKVDDFSSVKVDGTLPEADKDISSSSSSTVKKGGKRHRMKTRRNKRTKTT